MSKQRDIGKSFVSSLLMMSIDKGAMSFMSMIGTYDLTGIDLGPEADVVPKYPLGGYH